MYSNHQACISGNRNELSSALEQLDADELRAFIMKLASPLPLSPEWATILSPDEQPLAELQLKLYGAIIESISASTVDIRDFFQARAMARRLQAVCDPMLRMASGMIQTDTIMQLAELAIERLHDVMDCAASPNDLGEDLYWMLEDFEKLHLVSSQYSGADPVRLAEWLFGIGMRSRYDCMVNAYAIYAGLLGEEGRRHYRRLVDGKAEGRRREGRAHPSLRNRIAEIRDIIHEEMRNPGAILADEFNLPVPSVISAPGRDSRAGTGIIAGLPAHASGFPHMFSPLNEIAARVDQLIAMNKAAEATELATEMFKLLPDQHSFALLKKAAVAAGSWDKQRDKVMKAIREIAEDILFGESAEAVPSLMIELLLSNDDTDAAWQIAMEEGCDDYAWLNLAGARAAEHPEDAIAIYETQIEKHLENGQSSLYEDLVRMVQLMEPLMNSSDRAADFAAYLAELRTRFKRKRKFIEMLNNAYPV